MEEQIAQVVRYIRMVWHFRWLALVLAFVTCVAGWIYVITLPDEYEVEAKVFLDATSMLGPVLKGLAIDSNTREQAVSMVRRTLLTRPNLESVIRSTDMDLTAQTPEQFEGLVEGLRNRVQVDGSQRSNIFRIAYTHEDPQLALRVVEAFLNIFVEKSLGESRKDSSSTRQFIDQQIKDYEARLNAAEERLKEFKRRNIGMLPGEGMDFYSQREQVSSQLAAARLELKVAVQRRNSLQAQLSGEEPVLGLGPQVSMPMQTSTATQYDSRIASLRERLDELLLQYTESHPDVQSVQSLIATLEARQEEEREKMLAEMEDEPVQQPGQSLAENPVYQQLKISLGQTESEVAGIQARVEEYEQRLETLSRRIDETLNVERELKALNRDYGINRRNYDELVKRRESLKMSDDASKSTDQIQFNIVEPPRVPLLPNKPDRVLLSSGVLVFGLGLGIAAALGFSILRPAFYSRNDLAEVTDLPVLGSVNRVLTGEENLKRRLGYAMFLAGIGLLLGIYGALTIAHQMHIDFLGKISGLMS